MFIQGTHSPATEREARGYRWLWAGPPPVPPVPAFVNVGRSIGFTKTEQPWHPGSFSWAGLPSAPVVAIERRWWVTIVEQPWHPSSFFQSGVKPVDIVRVQAEITDTLFVRQEQPWHPGSFLGAPAPPLPPPWRERRHWITTVEQPWHPGSWVQAPQPPSVVSASRRIWQTTTEQPWHPGAFTWSRPPTSIPPFINAGRGVGLWATKVEQPWHPVVSWVQGAPFNFLPTTTDLITSTKVIQLPIDAILAGQQDYEQGDSPILAGPQHHKPRLAVPWDSLPDFVTNPPKQKK